MTRKKMTSWIRLVATPTDHRILKAITVATGDDNMSSTVRRLIREEAARLGLLPQVKAELLAEAAKAE